MTPAGPFATLIGRAIQWPGGAFGDGLACALERRMPKVKLPGEIAEIASTMLAGSVSFIEGARRIAVLGFNAGLSDDPDIVPFIGIASHTDALPVTPAMRELWDTSALDKLQADIDEAEAWARGWGTSHCKHLIERFQQSIPKN